MTREIKRYGFLEVAVGYKHTCASKLPIILRTDPIGEFPNALFHADFCSLYIVRQGRGVHVINEVGYAVSRGDVYVMGPGEAHHFTDAQSLILDTIHFSPDIFDSETLDALADIPGFHAMFVDEPFRRPENAMQTQGKWLHLTPAAYDHVMQAYRELYSEWEGGTTAGMLLTRPLFLRFLIDLSRRYASTNNANERAPRRSNSAVAAAVQWIEENYQDTIRVEAIAGRVFLSPDRFTEVFQLEMGTTPSEYIRHVRLEHAKRMLVDTDSAISEVGMDAGFGEPGYFSRVFRENVGISPREFRRRERTPQ